LQLGSHRLAGFGGDRLGACFLERIHQRILAADRQRQRAGKIQLADQPFLIALGLAQCSKTTIILQALLRTVQSEGLAQQRW
jgi:hypothetical protein